MAIDKKQAHPRALQIIPEDFFWSCIDELAPFGSDEGDTSLAEFRNWRKQNSTIPTIMFLRWAIMSVGEMDFNDYNRKLLDRALIQSQIEDEDFDDTQFIYTLDNTVIATGFAQLVDEGIIDADNKELIQIAIERQILWAELNEGWDYAEQYIDNLKVLNRAIQIA